MTLQLTGLVTVRDVRRRGSCCFTSLAVLYYNCVLFQECKFREMSSTHDMHATRVGPGGWGAWGRRAGGHLEGGGGLPASDEKRFPLQ